MPHCDFVTSTTHKTLAGPRAGFVLCREEHASKVDRANFPGMQGGPLMHTIAAKAACFKIAMTEAFRDYQRQVRANADALAAGLVDGGFDVLTGGTDTHLVQLDLRATEWTGLAAQERLEECKLTANRNTVPFDERPPMVASGVRLGTPAATMRGFDEEDFREVAAIIVDSLQDDADVEALAGALAGAVRQATAVPGLPRLHDLRSVSVTEVRHPLVLHKLSYLRDKDTPTVHFRKLVEEVTLLLTYEATKDLPTEDVEIETPLERAPVPRISGKKVAVCPILRAGLGMLDGVLTLISGARVGFIGLYRDEETLQPVEYYVKLPQDVADRDVILLDPMLATGNSTAHAVRLVKDAGASSVRLISIIAAPEGIANIQRGAPRRADRRRGDRPPAERARLHRPRPRRRGRPPLRHEVGCGCGLGTVQRPPRGAVGRARRARDRPGADARGRARGPLPPARRPAGRRRACAPRDPAARRARALPRHLRARRSRSCRSAASCAACSSAPESRRRSARSTTSAG